MIGCLLGKGDISLTNLLHLAVEPGRKEVKLIVIEPESSLPLSDTSLAKKKALLTASECLAHKGPLFERNRHGFGILPYATLQKQI